jgi:hypothetical protein
MSSTPPGHPTTPTWKDHGGDADPSTRQPWRREAEPAAPGYRRRSRGRRLLIAFLLFAAICGVLIWVSLWLRPARGTSVLVFYAGYEDQLAVPHNVYGRAGGEALARLAGANPVSASFWGSGTLQLNQQPRQLDLSTWDQDLSRVREKTLLVYMALHGGADGQGAYLVPQDAVAPLAAGLGDPSANFLRLSAVFDKLKKSVPRNRNIVLVLDCTQVPGNVPLGMLHNTFAHELARLEDQIIDIPNLVVLCASDEDQQSWASEDVGKTIFSHYVIEGLKGAADGAASEDGTRDGRINAYELHKYVSDHVAAWVRRNRGAEQTPVLWPRKDKIGEQRARAMHLTVVPTDYVAPVVTPLPVFVPPSALVDAWKRRDQVAAQVPPPGAYAPHLWRQYLDWLLRYEELLQAGEKDVSRTIPSRLRDLEQQIQYAQKLDLESLGNTLAMPAVAQAWGPADPQTQKAFDRLWDVLAKDIVKEWAELQKSGGELLRIKLCELALERLLENPSGYLPRATLVLRTLDNPLQPRAAEAHFAVMLHRDLLRTEPGNLDSPPFLPPKYLKSAIETRLRAERAALGLEDGGTLPLAGNYAYAEQVLPWIQGTVAEADKLRREGQDLLLATDAVNWERGRELLLEADRKYRQAQVDATRVRLALSVRDRVLPVLPYYGQWLAARLLAAEEIKSVKEGTLRQQVLELWPEVHALGELLDRRALEGVDGGEKALKRTLVLQGLSEHAARVQRKFNVIAQGFQDYCKQLDEVDSIAGWHNLDHALLMPTVDATLRGQLLAKRSRISRDLFNASMLPGGDKAAVLNDRAYRDRVKAAAVWRGRMALAAFGKRWTDESGGDRHETFDQLNKRLDTLVGPDWRASVTVAGTEVGLRWRELPLAIVKRTAAAAKGDAATNLREADRLVRLADGAASQQITENPARAYRKRLVQDLVLWQAERTMLDHWAGEDPTADPYFRVAGLTFLKDARGHERARKIEQQLAQEGKLQIVLAKAPGLRPTGPGTAVLHWTSEDEFPLQIRVQGQGELVNLSGNPVVWVETGPAVKAVAPKAGQRLAHAIGGKAEPPLLCTLQTDLVRKAEEVAPALPAPADEKVIFHGLFRGQPLRLETRLLIHPVAETVVTSHPMPATASLAVRAPREAHADLGTSRGALTIVLDCTGSMGPRKGQPVESSKYYEATEALRQVLQKVPRGTVVSLWIFGQAVGAEKTVTNPADTIEQIQPPTAWNPEDDAKINEIITRAQGYQPWNLSPIFRAMYTAAKKDLARADGFKTLIVITDGMDNCFDKDEALHGGKKDPRAFILENFADIQVNVIGFKFAGKEEEEARKQFAAIAELPHKGQFYTVNESRDLVFRIQKVLPQKLRYVVETEDDQPLKGLSVEGQDVSQIGRNDQWILGGLMAGTYKLRFTGARPLTQSVALNRGDLLLLELVYDLSGKQQLQRVMYSEADFPGAVARDREAWRLAVLQNQRLQEKSLQMLLALEKQSDPQAAALQVVKPAKVWFEVSPPAELVASYVTRWHYQPGYPAPCWGVDVPAWPSVPSAKNLARPTVRAWWTERLLPPAAVMERGTDFQNLFGLVNRKLSVEEEDVLLESVTVETHFVETQPGVRGTPGQLKKMPCLVVRVAHPRGKPVWVQLRGLDPIGQEHRFYGAANKYTAIFWPVTLDQAETELAGLEVYSLAAFKRGAEGQKCMIEIKGLYEPQATEQRPMQPLKATAEVPAPEKEAPPGPKKTPPPPAPQQPVVTPPALTPPPQGYLPSPQLD